MPEAILVGVRDEGKTPVRSCLYHAQVPDSAKRILNIVGDALLSLLEGKQPGRRREPLILYIDDASGVKKNLHLTIKEHRSGTVLLELREVKPEP